MEERSRKKTLNWAFRKSFYRCSLCLLEHRCSGRPVNLQRNNRPNCSQRSASQIAPSFQETQRPDRREKEVPRVHERVLQSHLREPTTERVGERLQRSADSKHGCLLQFSLASSQHSSHLE